MSDDRELSKMVAEVNSLFNDPERDKRRTKENVEILKEIIKHLKSNPTLRFNQALYNLGTVLRDNNTYYEEPEFTLKRMRIRLKELEAFSVPKT